jgi:mRNA-degrading endonuclease RelE of RelBE toxin-antitoxin system
MKDNLLATGELRVGKFRVFYDIDNDTVKIVYVLAIGYKDHN